MSQVGEAYRPEGGLERPAAGFLASAVFLSTLRRLFGGVDMSSAPTAPLPTQLQQAILPHPQQSGLSGSGRSSIIPSGQADEPLARQIEVERLCAHLSGSGSPGRARRILITHPSSMDAPLAGLDCAAFASQLARSLAHEGRTILVVFGAGGGSHPGLSELIDGSASFSEAIHREAGSRLHILPSGRGRAAAGAGLTVVLDALSGTYDYVVLSATDEDRDALRRLSLLLAPQIDHVLIGCPGQMGSPDMVALRDALKDEGAGEVIATRIGVTPTESREAA